MMGIVSKCCFWLAKYRKMNHQGSLINYVLLLNGF